MKKIIQFTLGATLTISAIGAQANDNAVRALMTTSAPTMFSALAVSCLDIRTTDEALGCGIGLPIFGAISSTTLSVVLLLKEDIQQVAPDAHHFLAGETMTDSLQETINQLREDEELKDRSDVDLSILIIELVGV
ncbi:hypothetical protein ACJVC5_18285 [Peredibacter sp. HCB2-198]|uniref:hypothetical protein n=1 Tax=Peredibacter sp. HCB2-198 TaxID=3383025 RepID=UPI0038B4FE97